MLPPRWWHLALAVLTAATVLWLAATQAPTHSWAECYHHHGERNLPNAWACEPEGWPDRVRFRLAR